MFTHVITVEMNSTSQCAQQFSNRLQFHCSEVEMGLTTLAETATDPIIPKAQESTYIRTRESLIKATVFVTCSTYVYKFPMYHTPCAWLSLHARTSVQC